MSGQARSVLGPFPPLICFGSSTCPECGHKGPQKTAEKRGPGDLAWHPKYGPDLAGKRTAKEYGYCRLCWVVLPGGKLEQERQADAALMQQRRDEEEQTCP